MEPNKKSFGYWLGYVCGSVLIACVMAIALALTYKFITWLIL